MCEIRENAMQKKQFQQNMKDKVRVFEDGGIRLLKRGQKGVVHAIFSRFGLVLVLLLLQAFALFSLLQWFGELLPHYFGGTLLVTAAMMVYLLNQDMDNSVRITWLVVTALMPVLGVPLFWYTKSDVGHNALKRRLLDLEGWTRAQLPQNEQTVELLQEQAPEAVPLARYLRGKGGGFPVYADTVATYFNGGEAMFDEMLRQLETAKKYIARNIPDGWMPEDKNILVNPTGRFVIGGPDGDTGLTGRKIIVDNYGGYAPHGGGAFSGKDATKVDRSAAYMLRYLAKNVVAAGLADECLLQLSYAIGVADPLSFYINCNNTARVDEQKILQTLKEMTDLTPKGIINRLQLRRPIYTPSSAYGHFGRAPQPNGAFSWEKTDLAKELTKCF